MNICTFKICLLYTSGFNVTQKCYELCLIVNSLKKKNNIVYYKFALQMLQHKSQCFPVWDAIKYVVYLLNCIDFDQSY